MADNLDISMNEFLPLREVVYMTLRKAILKGEFKPGERLMEITLANRLGVSRTPIREAIRKLEHEGLVVMIPRKGAQVSKITVQELNDVLEVRKSLELLAAEKACERITPEEAEELKKRAAAFEELIDTGDLTGLAEADVAFHDVIYNATKNRRLIQILNNLREQMYRFRVEYLKERDVLKRLVEEHRGITKAITGHDAKEAMKITALHIDNQRQAINSSIRETEDGKQV
jgi:DNA-binding GntR family transcriptional regulator